MNTMVLGVRKRRHCERGERGQTAPRVTLPLRSLCILMVACIWAQIWILFDCSYVLIKNMDGKYWGWYVDVRWSWLSDVLTLIWKNGIINILICTKTDESFSTQPCLLGQHLYVNKSYGDYVDSVTGNLVLVISMFLLEGLHASLWAEKSPTCRHDETCSKPTFWKTEKCFVIKLKPMLSSWEADRFYPSALAFCCWYSAPPVI